MHIYIESNSKNCEEETVILIVHELAHSRHFEFFPQFLSMYVVLGGANKSLIHDLIHLLKQCFLLQKYFDITID